MMDGCVDFTYYVENYFGNIVIESEFNFYVQNATRYVKKLIAAVDYEITESIKLAICAVCDVLKVYGGRLGIKSESNDGCSVSYDVGVSDLNKQIYDAAKLYLDGNLLYRGLL